MLRTFYYDKLSAPNKKVYDELLNGMKSRKTEIAISGEPKIEILQALSFEHPELYYVDFTNVPFKRFFWGCQANIKYKKIYNEENLRGSLNKIISNLQSDSTESIIRSLHNYFVKNIKYDSQNVTAVDNHNIVGALLYGKAVCEGISKAVQYVLNTLGIDNTVAIGMCENDEHMWNVVNINGFNYHIDVTADINLTNKSWNKPGYFYYLITDEDISKTHQFTENFNCYSKLDNPFYHSQKIFYDIGQLTDYITSLNGNQNLLYFKYLGNKSPDDILEIVSMNWKRFSIIGARLYMAHASSVYYIWR